LKVLLAGVVLLAGCTTVEYRILATETIKNDKGHVVGHKDKLRDVQTGEEFETVTNYIPRLNAKGDVVGYEEPTPPRGTVLRGLDGRRVGLRYRDLRSRGSNPGSEGLTVIISP
jgi:hypothetical protein